MVDHLEPLEGPPFGIISSPMKKCLDNDDLCRLMYYEAGQDSFCR